MPPYRPVSERFDEGWSGEPNSGCWLWMGCCTKAGYGQINIKNRAEYAHRLSYQQAFGDPGEQCVLHKCDTPSCVNPQHLFLGTHDDNTQDMMRKNRCKSAWPRGSKHHKAQLTEQNVKDILAAPDSHTDLAKKYGVSYSSIWLIRLRKTWRHVTP